MQRKTSSILICLLALAASCNCAFAACPSADLTGDCLVNFLDFPLMALEGNLLDLHTMAGQWLESDSEPATISGRVDMQTDGPDSFAVRFVVVARQRIGRTVFRYECQVILTNLSPTAFENVQLVMEAWPDNMTIIDPHVTFGEAEIGPGESAAGMDTSTFTVDRSIPIDPLEIGWRYVAAPQDMVFIPGGTFAMGDNLGDGWSRELPVHTVTLDSFFMGKYEITNRQYCDYLNSALSQGLITVTSGRVYKAGSGTSYPYCNTSTSSSSSQIAYSMGGFSVRTKSGRDMSYDPMVEVSWYGAAAYCNWRSQQEAKELSYNLSTWNCDFSKKGYRLATEAEWEYAARGGLAGRRFPWGDTISHSQANYRSYWEEGSPSLPYDVSSTEGYHPTWDDGVYPHTSPVGFFDGTMKYKTDYQWPGSATSYQTTSGANSYGLYDMVANVGEWCNDWWGLDYYDYSPTNNPPGPITGVFRVLRGGGWGRSANYCRVAYRYYDTPVSRNPNFGFRCVLDLN